MGLRLEEVEVIKLDPAFTPAECQNFIEKWNKDNPEKYNNDAFMPLFSPFIDRCELIKSTNIATSKDLLTVIMVVSPDNWPNKREVADITMFVTSLKNNYTSLDVKMMFDVRWSQ